MKQSIIVITTHVIMQLLIYSMLTYLHLGMILITLILPPGPNMLELVYMHSASVLVSLVIAALFIFFWRHTWRLNRICIIVNLVLIIMYSGMIWQMYDH